MSITLTTTGTTANGITWTTGSLIPEQTIVTENATATEVPPEQPEVEAVPGDPPEPPEQEEDTTDQAKAALRTAALIIKTATDEIAAAEVTYDTEHQANAAWASALTKDAWTVGNAGRHCSTWDAIMKSVGLPGRPKPIQFVCNATVKVAITVDTMVEAMKTAGFQFETASLKAFAEALDGVEYQGQMKSYRYTIEVTPEPPDDPFNPNTQCLCPQARAAFIKYIHDFVDAKVKITEVTVENPKSRCPATTHQEGIHTTSKRKRVAQTVNPEPF